MAAATDDPTQTPRASRDVLRLVHSDRDTVRPKRRVWEKFESYRNWALVPPADPAPEAPPRPAGAGGRSRPKRD
jgi:hypothetical protein